MRTIFKIIGIAASVAGVMVLGGVADRHSKKFSGVVDGAEKGLKSAKNWIKGVVQPK